MALIVFDDVILPECVALAGVVGRDMRLNDRSQNQGGFDTINIIRQRTLRQFEIGIKPMYYDDWLALIGLYELTEAGAYGFLMKDPKDSSVRAGEGVFQPLDGDGAQVGTAGFGYGVPSFQLAKQYRVEGSARFKSRIITRVAPGALLSRAGVPLVIGDDPGEISYANSTGRVDFEPDASESISSIDTGLQTTLFFPDNTGIIAEMTAGERLYVRATTGTAALLLNGKSHLIASIGSNFIILQTDTDGLAAGSGVAERYAQEGEALTWTGEFYVPVHFMDDDLQWQIEKPGDLEDRIISGSATLIEIRE